MIFLLDKCIMMRLAYMLSVCMLNKNYVRESELMKLNNPNLLQTKAFINGFWVETSASYAVLNPASLVEVAQVSKCGAKECNAAINAAHTALTPLKKNVGKRAFYYIT